MDPTPSQKPSIQVNRGNLEETWTAAMRHYKADRHSEALSHFQALFEYFKRDEYDPNFIKCAEYLGMCYVNVSDFDKAAKLFNDVNSRGSFPSQMASWGLLLIKHKGDRDAATKEKYG
ncbi:MAG: tetratricopeptide repeat protein [Limisphaerales bacterium]